MSRIAPVRLKVRIRDNSGIRRLMKSGVGRRLRRTRIGRGTDTWFLRRRAFAGSADLHTSVDEVTTACLFIGHVKSGGSLVGAMLDAHPEIVIGDEVDLARLMRARIPADAMLSEFVRSARRESMRGRVTARRLGGYSLEITGWSQGHSEHARVIGNSRPGPTTRYLADVPGALEGVIEAFSDRRLLFIHVIRNPQDSIAAMVLRSGRDIVDAARDHAAQCERLAALRSHLGDRVHSIRYESLIGDCPQTLSPLLEFLDVEPPLSYLTACTNLLDDGLVPESDRVSWNTAALDIVNGSVHRFEFLAPYRS